MTCCQHCQRIFSSREDFLRHTEQNVRYDNPQIGPR